MHSNAAPRQTEVYDLAPAELRKAAQWLAWKYEGRGGPKPTKVPYNARTGGPGSSTDAATWSTFDEAVAAVNCRRMDGVGYALLPGSGVAGLDLDDCIDADGEIAEWAAAIIERVDSYTEVSPSGRGVRIFFYGVLPGSGHSRKLHKLDEDLYPGANAAIELYDQGRFLTVTGRHIPTTPTALKRRQDAMLAIHNEYWPPEAPRTERFAHPPMPAHIDDVQLLEVMFRAKNGAAVRALFDGDVSAYGGDESAADLALLDHLAFYTGCDAGRMERLFSQSALGQRAKWVERADYRQRTIDKAIAGCNQIYSGRALNSWPEHTLVPEVGPDDGSCQTCAILRVRLEKADAELVQLRARESLRASLLRRSDYKPIDRLLGNALLNLQGAHESHGKTGPLRVIVDQLERTDDNADWIDSSLVAMTGASASSVRRSLYRLAPIEGGGLWQRHYETYSTADGTPHKRLYLVPAGSAPEQWVTIATAEPPAAEPKKDPPRRRVIRCKRHPFEKVLKETTWKCTACGRHAQEPQRETLDPCADPPDIQNDNQADGGGGMAEPGPAPGRALEQFVFPAAHFDNQGSDATESVEASTKPSQIDTLVTARRCVGCGEHETRQRGPVFDVGQDMLLHLDCSLAPVAAAS